jgi:Mechanosensitive ion channel
MSGISEAENISAHRDSEEKPDADESYGCAEAAHEHFEVSAILLSAHAGADFGRARRPDFTGSIRSPLIGYFVLVGSHGIRIGDRVQLSGVTGSVTDMGWLQFQIKEIDRRTRQPTGNVVTFSNYAQCVERKPPTPASERVAPFGPRRVRSS